MCDFGLCLIINDDNREQLMSDFCGSPGFFAPEMVLTKAYDPVAADIWSLGCVLLEVLLGHEVFYEVWVGAYDYSLMRQPAKFKERMNDAIRMPCAWAP